MKAKKKKATKRAAKALRKNIATVVRAGLEPLKRPPVGKNIPADIKAPGFGEVRGDSFVKPGRYIMRNGSAAIVVKAITVKFGIQMRQTWQGWKGYLDGHPEGEGLTWGLDGKRSDAAPMHEHDLIRRHKNQKFSCVKCGCTDDRACKGGCSWVAPGFCSACFPGGILA